MKRLQAGIVGLAVMLAVSAVAGEREPAISVTGKAEEAVKPDVAYVTLYVQADGMLLADAVKKMDKLVEEIRVALEPATNVIREIKIEDVSLGEKSSEYWRSDEKQEAPRPQVARRIRLACEPAPAALYDIIDLGLRAGALMQLPSRTSYSDDLRSVVIYGVEQSTAVLERLRKRALDDARAKAEKSAALAGKAIGGVVTLGCGDSQHWGMAMRVMGRQIDFPTEYIGVNADEIRIAQSVSVTYELTDP